MIPRGEYPDESSSNSHGDRRAYNEISPPGRRRYHGGSGRPLDRGNNHDRGYSRRGRPPEIMEDPLMMKDYLEMDGIQDTLEDEDHLAHQDPLDW